MVDEVEIQRAEFSAWLGKVNRERRFGEHDRRGTANLIDEVAKARAASSVRSGASISIARPLRGIESVRGDGRPGFSLEVFLTEYEGKRTMASDHVEFDCHGPMNTHLDALNHSGKDGTWYCGWPIEGAEGGPDVAVYAEEGLVSRAVFVDIPAHRGKEWVDVELTVTGADIDGALSSAGLSFESGDALLLYMGRDRYEASVRPWNHDERDSNGHVVVPGVGGDGARWIVDHGVSVLCWDMLDAVHPLEPGDVHSLIWAIGLLLVDNCDFAALRAAVGTGTQIVGALVVAPLSIEGGTGCNVNPLVIR